VADGIRPSNVVLLFVPIPFSRSLTPTVLLRPSVMAATVQGGPLLNELNGPTFGDVL
jgi:hypothetical protein